MTPISGWENFYVIVGSSAAALTGLQFVVMALVADLPVNGSARSIDAFATPTMVHFGAVLLLSAVLSAPWRSVGAPMLLCTLCGATGLVYVVIVARRTRTQTDYTPVFEDWLFHVMLPAAAYLALTSAVFVARSYAADPALFGIATATFLLLVIGIHNAWDTVTYLVLTRGQQPPNTP
ncbi:MAG TPA: hypothetical protein VGJ29_08335 [Vicinamibacterales bacterium]